MPAAVAVTRPFASAFVVIGLQWSIVLFDILVFCYWQTPPWPPPLKKCGSNTATHKEPVDGTINGFHTTQSIGHLGKID